MSQSLKIDSVFALPNGHKLPMLGFGVWDSPKEVTTKSVVEALKVGYKHIDGAQGYGNEIEVGKAVKQSGVARQDVFLTSKIFSPGKDAAETEQSLAGSVEKMGGDEGYLDLVLIHNANVGHDKRKLMWQAMEKLHHDGKIKSIGASNFGIGHLEDTKKYAKVWPPAVNQLELHPWLQQREVVEYCRKNNIVIEAYCPLVRNQKANDPTLKAIAEKHGKTTAQVLVRYCLEKGWSPLPKSDTPSRIAQNADVFNFQLDKGDMKQLDDQPQEAALVLAVDNEDTK